ncbi:MAG: class I SAM-dependent methyltransferase [Verrucomicrobiae bacterium]|nr:class I SAM-dependent methyltransferase [Verrucomicrobiae bacterium]
MPNKFLSHNERRAPKVRELFTTLAPRYDLANDIQSFGLHRRWKQRVAALATAGARPGWRVLDLCCGTGDLTFAARRGGATLVVGLDFTEAMLRVAARRRAPNDGGARFVLGDALRLPFADASFDAVTVGYGLRNVADIEASLREMLRVLRPGGRMVILDFGKPDNRLGRACYLGWLRATMPLMGWLFHRDPDTYRYIIASLETFPAQRGMESMMRRAGMVAVRVHNLLLGTMAINYGERPA